MAHIAKGTTNTQRDLPTSGLHQALCIDVYDAGFTETSWGPKEKTMIVWELTEKHPEYQGPFRVNRKYTTSLHEKSNMSKDLESWRGKGFTDQERKEGVDLEKLIGVGCHLNIIHHLNEQTGITYANVAAIMPLVRFEWPEPSGYYTRKVDQPSDQPPAPQHTEQQEAEKRQRYGPSQDSGHRETPPVEAYENEHQTVVDHHGFAQDSLPF